MPIDDSKFEERADYISDEDLENWNVPNSHFDRIQQKLIGPGAKLIRGPRGTGKTHQMRLAYHKCLRDKTKPLPLYVSFNRYYRLEPFLFKSSNALKIFHSWVLCKIIDACYEVISATNGTIEILENDNLLSKDNLSDFIAQTEKGIGTIQPWHDQILSEITIPKVISIIEELLIKNDRHRAILILDDAALTLTPDYMVEFFDIFRCLKTRFISPKASVYPGTTMYGPRFHIGQDAEPVEAWISIEDSNYSQFMDTLINKRFSETEREHIYRNVPKEIVELLKYSAFGIPRTFIVLLRKYIQAQNQTAQSKFNYVISEQASLIRDEYLSLGEKMKQYKTMIGVGYEAFKNIIEAIRKENSDDASEKQIIIGIKEENDLNILRMNKFLIEAGLLYELTPVSHGEDREYLRFIPHMLFLIDNRTFSQGHGFNSKKIEERIKRKSKKHPVRRTISSLIGEELIDNLHIDLPPCQYCRADRIREEQRFCHNCGKELIGKSAFEECLKIPIDKLPISTLQKDRIKKETNIKVIGDLFSLTDPQTELRKARGIGRIKSEKIMKIVEELLNKEISEFLA